MEGVSVMDWKSIVKTVAPWIGTALGGPFGGMAASAVADVFGLSEKTEASIKQALSGATPEQMLMLKTADQNFAARMQELGFQNIENLERIAAENTKDARAMQVAIRSKIPATLSILITVGFFGILYGMLKGFLTVSENQALLIMLGALGTAWGNVVNYWFGSTHDSGRKTDMLAKADAIK
jgi:hypothetical protein